MLRLSVGKTNPKSKIRLAPYPYGPSQSKRRSLRDAARSLLPHRGTRTRSKRTTRASLRVAMPQALRYAIGNLKSKTA